MVTKYTPTKIGCKLQASLWNPAFTSEVMISDVALEKSWRKVGENVPHFVKIHRFLKCHRHQKHWSLLITMNNGTALQQWMLRTFIWPHCMHQVWFGWKINVPFQHKNRLYQGQSLGRRFSSARLRMANDTATSQPRSFFSSTTQNEKNRGGSFKLLGPTLALTTGWKLTNHHEPYLSLVQIQCDIFVSLLFTSSYNISISLPNNFLCWSGFEMLLLG